MPYPADCSAARAAGNGERGRARERSRTGGRHATGRSDRAGPTDPAGTGDRAGPGTDLAGPRARPECGTGVRDRTGGPPDRWAAEPCCRGPDPRRRPVPGRRRRGPISCTSLCDGWRPAPGEVGRVLAGSRTAGALGRDPIPCGARCPYFVRTSLQKQVLMLEQSVDSALPRALHLGDGGLPDRPSPAGVDPYPLCPGLPPGRPTACLRRPAPAPPSALSSADHRRPPERSPALRLLNGSLP